MASPRVTPQFLQEYRKLNAAQKKAVDTIEGPVMVVAGPGTGKTQILTLRIANILKETDTPPDAVLALTFTESGVAAMRRRLVKIIGSEAYRVHIHTFHGFCNEVIKRFPDAFPRIIGGEPITDIEKISIIRNLIEESDFEQLKPFGNNFHYVNDVRQHISELKRENISPSAFRTYVEKEEKMFRDIPDLFHEKGTHKGVMKGKYQSEERRIIRSKELSLLYERYEEKLAEVRKYDFEDMIMEVVGGMQKNADLLLRIQEEYHYILADEHQDANTAQNTLLELITNFHQNPNLFIVGDEKQAIFRFQGASLENFLYFKRLYPKATLVQLEESYRSGQQILDSAHSMMVGRVTTEEERELRKPLVSRTGTGAEVAVHSFPRREQELAWVVQSIQGHIAEGVEPSELAILYRTNGEAEQLVRACEDRGVIVSVESEQNVLGDPDIRKFIVLLRALTHYGVDEWMASVMHLPFVDIDPLDVYKIIRYARKEHLLFAEVMRSEKHLSCAGVEGLHAVQSLSKKIHAWAKREGSVPETVSTIVRESGFLTYILNSSRAVELIEKLAGLTRDIEALAQGNPEYSLKMLVEHLTLLDEYRIPIKKEVRAAPRKGAVRLMTAHRSKGLEFDYVYIVNTVDGVWGGRRSTQLFALPTGGVRGEDDDERRLLYVALTRARVGVHLTCAEEKDGKVLLPTRFLEEIDTATYTISAHTENYDPKDDLLRERMVTSPALPDKSFLNELFLEQGLSVTALNNYLACPWNYFYSSLIRIPKSPNVYALYGVAVHAALQRFFNEMAEGKPTQERLRALFQEAVRALPISQKEQDDMRARGEVHLSGWYATWHKTWSTQVRTEYRIQTEFMNGAGMPNVVLHGILDKVEFLFGDHVRVVDYKTGKPKTRNAIMGKTKSDDGGYFRQLVFYKLLLDGEGKYKMDEALLDFVQPNEKGEYHREAFEINPEDERALRETISRVSEEIWNLSFWNSRCEDTTCEFCALRDLMK